MLKKRVRTNFLFKLIDNYVGCQLNTCLVKRPVRSRLSVHAYDSKRKRPYSINHRNKYEREANISVLEKAEKT